MRGGKGNWVEKTISGSRIVVLTDGTKIEMYPLFYFLMRS